MPEVPPYDRDLEAADAGKAPPPDEQSRVEVVLTPLPDPFGEGDEGQRNPEPPHLSSAGVEAPARDSMPAPPNPPAEAAPTTTTGVPHYPPPATPPFPRAPELDAGADGTRTAEAVAATPPAQRRSILRPLGRGVRELAETVILALLIFLLVRAVVQNFQVEGRSMEPTLETSWYLLVNKALYWEINLETVNKFVPFVDPGDDPTRYIFRGPKRGDVIVFRSPNQSPGQPERDFIKRVIAVQGETVEVRDCTVFIDGQPLDEPYIFEGPRYTFGPETVPPDHYFVLGDNRNNSSDSHSWGMLPKENIIGQAWITYWPFSTFGLIDNTSVTPGDGEFQESPAGVATKPGVGCSVG